MYQSAEKAEYQMIQLTRFYISAPNEREVLLHFAKDCRIRLLLRPAGKIAGKKQKKWSEGLAVCCKQFSNQNIVGERYKKAQK